jgi:asparagine synthase (glutamine-hydrolysing)
MCGITGFLSSPSSDDHQFEALVCQMTGQLVHRGPDDFGTWVDRRAGIALGHRRLSILDLSAGGHQPMLSSSGRYVIVFNGEVYNFLSLRHELERMGHHFRGCSDTEVVLATVDQWGVEEAVLRFNGMFAFAIWDREERQLYLVRDRLGEKPLYYGWMGKSFVFGSELKALRMHPGFRDEIDRGALAMYLRYSCIPAPHSIYRGIRKLPPATMLVVKHCDEGNLPAPVRYWSASEAVLHGAHEPYKGSEKEAAVDLDELLRDAVKMRMVSDVPLGAFLSGGIDSSTIVAMMQAQSTRPVKTLSIGFHDDHYNEAKFANAVAFHLGTDHTKFYVSAEDARQTIPLLPRIFDEPFADSSQIPTYLVSRLARQHVTVSLSGDGGDELFGGYTRYLRWGSVWNKARYLPQPLRQAFSQGLLSVSASQWNHLWRSCSSLLSRDASDDFPGDRIHRLAHLLSAKNDLLRHLAIVSVSGFPCDIVNVNREREPGFRQQIADTNISNFSRYMMLADSISFLPDDILAKVDRVSMAVSLEVRAPFLDHRVFEFAARLPYAMKIRKGRGKWLLRRVVEQYLPKHLFERPKKGFSLPMGEWLRGPLREWAEDLLDPARLRSEGYFQADAVQTLWQEHISRQREVSHHIWAVLMFQSWLDEWKGHNSVQPRQTLQAMNQVKESAMAV